MTFFNYFKTNTILVFKQFPTLLFGYLIMPLVLGVFMAYSTEGLFEPRVEDPLISVYIKNEGSFPVGQQLNLIFQKLAKDRIFKMEDSAEEARYTITIPEGLEQALQASDSSQANIQLTRKPSSSQTELMMLEVILASIMEPFVEEAQLQSLVEAKEGETIDIKELTDSINQQVSAISYQQYQHQNHLSLSARQYYSVSLMGFIFGSIFLGVALSGVKTEFRGLNKRIELLPLTVRQQVIYDVIVNVNQFVILSFCYLLIWKLLDGRTFSGNLWEHSLLLVLNVTFIVSLAHLVLEVVHRRFIQPIASLMQLLLAFLSGMLPIGQLTSKAAFAFLTQNPIQQLFIDPYFAVIRQLPVTTYSRQMIILGAGSLSMLIALIFIRSRRKEYR